MLNRCPWFALLAILLITAAPAAATGNDPEQHDAQRLASDGFVVGDLGSMQQSAGFQCENGQAGPYPCQNVDMESFVTLPQLGGATGNDIWGWTDPETGREYAIMGTSNSTGFVDVTDPKDPVLVGVLPTRGIPDAVLWRDIKVDGNYAFIVSEISRSGLQVFDLTRLRGRTSPTILDSDATYDEFSWAHNISINTESNYAYVVGSNTCGNEEEDGGLHMVDISDPLTPTFAGCAIVDDPGNEPESNNYAHDVECVVYNGRDRDYKARGRAGAREICFGSNENAVVIYDVTDKENPRVLSVTSYETAAYTHQGSLTPDQRYFVFGDEGDEQDHGVNTTTYIMPVSDLDDPGTPKPYAHESSSIDHNLYIHGNRVFQSNYMEGLRILEYDDQSLAAGELSEVAYFDVLPGLDLAQFAGTWSNYRFPGSGTVVVSTIENEVNGMFVLTPQLPEAECPDKPGGGKGKGGGNGKGKGGGC